MRLVCVMLTAIAFSMLPSSASASPWIQSDDKFLRVSIQQLADVGIITTPINTYPLPWRDIREALQTLDPSELSPQSMQALRYIESAMAVAFPCSDNASHCHPVSQSFSVSSGSGVNDLQAFGLRQDNRTQATYSAAYGSEGMAAKLSVNLNNDHYDPQQDDQALTLDGSYLAKQFGNWWLSVEQTSQYWGPGNSNSLIHSNNARPFPALRVSRDSAQPFDTPWLAWLGPWSLSSYLGQQESSNLLPDIKLWGMRVNFRPQPSLEIGLSRVSQWGGAGREENLSVFLDMLVGLDNGQGGRTGDREAGNQLAGIDFRWHSALFSQPFTLYGEYIGEDESGHLPSHFFYLSGIETQFAVKQGLAHGYFEYTDTTVDCRPIYDSAYNCGYNHHMMVEGYRRYGRAMGSTYDNDSIAYTLGGRYIDGDDQWHSQISLLRLNIDGTGEHPLTDGYQKRIQWDVGYQTIIRGARVLLEASLFERDEVFTGESDVDGLLRVNWRYQW